MATNFLGLDLPTVTVTLGPEWANKVNAAFEVVDAHDHTSGKGVRIPTAGLNINADLDFNSSGALALSKAGFSDNSSPLIGANNVRSLYVADGNLYYTNESGTAVQITDGGAIITSAGALQTVERQAVSSDLIISPSDTFVFLSVDTSAPRSITLPLANSVASGRVYIVKDASNNANTNNITLNAQGSDNIDGSSSYVLDSNLGSWWVVGNGVDRYDVS